MRALVAASFVLLLLVGCGDTCTNDVRASVPSPSGRLHAVVFARECGATVGFNTQVSLVAAAEQPEDSGNVVVLKGKVPLQLRWQSETELIVTGAAATAQFKREVLVGAVRVRYE